MWVCIQTKHGSQWVLSRSDEALLDRTRQLMLDAKRSARTASSR